VTRREAWFAAQPDLDPERLVFIDETGTSTKTARLRGRALGNPQPALPSAGIGLRSAEISQCKRLKMVIKSRCQPGDG